MTSSNIIHPQGLRVDPATRRTAGRFGVLRMIIPTFNFHPDINLFDAVSSSDLAAIFLETGKYSPSSDPRDCRNLPLDLAMTNIVDFNACQKPRSCVYSSDLQNSQGDILVLRDNAQSVLFQLLEILNAIKRVDLMQSETLAVLLNEMAPNVIREVK